MNPAFGFGHDGGMATRKPVGVTAIRAVCWSTAGAKRAAAMASLPYAKITTVDMAECRVEARAESEVARTA